MADARAAHDWLLNRSGLVAGQIVLFGRSLGGGVAVDLAADRGARGIVLQNTFTTIPDVAARLFPWLPVRRLMTNRYDSLSKIGRYGGPAFFSHGTEDTLTPYASAEQVRDRSRAAGVASYLITFQDDGHVPYVEHRATILDVTTSFLYNVLDVANAG